MFTRKRFESLTEHADAIAQIRRGRIIMADGRLLAIEEHWLASPVSIAQVWWASNYGQLSGDLCWIDFHVPRGLEDYLTLDYIRSGSGTRYATFVGVCKVLDQIAQLRRSAAIVAHITNGRISDRFLQRMGWERHLLHWRGRHYIRRFEF